MPKIAKYGIILFVITAVTGLILGGVYTMTLEPIRLVQEKEKNEALASTLPGATDFKAVEIKEGNPMITEIYEGSANGSVMGYNFTVTPKGYAGLVTTVVGVNNEGRVMDIKILSHSETPGLGAKAVEPAFAGQFKEKLAEKLSVTKTPPESDDQILAISGATITSSAVVSGVNTALEYWRANFANAGAPATVEEAAEEAAEAVVEAAVEAVETAAEEAAEAVTEAAAEAVEEASGAAASDDAAEAVTEETEEPAAAEQTEGGKEE